jgi:hypothetical protein
MVLSIRSNKREFVRVNLCHLGIHIAVFPSTSSSIEALMTADIAGFSCCHLLPSSRISRNAKQKMLSVDNSSKQKEITDSKDRKGLGTAMVLQDKNNK